ncbi:MAG TPA: hypothetical protein VGL86_32280 [Polyangia bacterium]
MSNASGPVILTVRGTLVPKTLEAARVLHNETAGSPPGIAAARALGDLSHKVYAPSLRSQQSGAKAGELLFHDVWDDVAGIMQFFGNAHVHEQAGKLFSARDATVWMPARGSFSYSLPVPAHKTERCLGMIRGPIASPEKAIEIFAKADAKAQREARRRGIISHELFIKLNAPGDDSPLELLGLDLWSDFAGMSEHYANPEEMKALGAAFSGAPTAAVWEQAPGQWSEW